VGEQRVHTRVVVYVAGLLVVVLLAAVVTWRLLGATSTYQQAIDTLPESTLRATYTDWTHVLSSARGSSLGSRSSKPQVESFLRRAYDLDLTAGSAVADSTYALQQKLGFSPLDAAWEAFGQGKEGQVDVLRLRDGVDLGGIEDTLRKLGYQAPKTGTGKGGTWVGGGDLVAQIDSELTPVQNNVAVLADDHLVLMSDNAAYLSAATAVAKGDADSMAEAAGADSLAGAAGDPVVATQWASTFACEDLSMGQADDEDQQEGERLVEKAGDISPVEGVLMAQQADRSLVFGLHFETEDQASRNLQTRVDLASGPAPGQGGTFPERFTITSGATDGQNVVISARPKSRTTLLSDISSGPVLFATC
jgi:hypothetical protein